MRDPDRAPGSWLQPDPSPVIAAIWGSNPKDGRHLSLHKNTCLKGKQMHKLECSKMNHYQENWKQNKKPRESRSKQTHTPQLRLSLLGLTSAYQFLSPIKSQLLEQKLLRLLKDSSEHRHKDRMQKHPGLTQGQGLSCLCLEACALSKPKMCCPHQPQGVPQQLLAAQDCSVNVFSPRHSEGR